MSGQAKMTSLQLLIQDLHLNECEVLNALQGEAGLISDLCVTASDVGGEDIGRAVNWVINNRNRFL